MAAVLAALIVMCLGACGKENTNVVYFQNGMGETVDGFYISSPEEDSWGDKLNTASIVSDGKIHVDAECLAEGAGALYDVPCITSSAYVCEIYEVELNIGDTITLSVNGEEGKCVVTPKEGEEREYTGYAYQQE